nr:MAG TPA: hypothetical protein [Caudoviricetes sp.]
MRSLGHNSFQDYAVITISVPQQKRTEWATTPRYMYSHVNPISSRAP